MPKRSIDATATPGTFDNKIMKKTERSHEENQERAYIAASRRADRSIEARVQSARMASDIHKKRTGKGFKISEEIVMREEMYEEEEDDIPRHYRALTAHLQTGGSSDFHNRMNMYVTSNVAMRTLAREIEVNKMFAEQFPNAHRVSAQMSQSNYYQPLQQNQQHQQTSPQPNSPLSPTFGSVNFAAPTHSRSQSVSFPGDVAHSPSPTTQHASLDTVLPPHPMSPEPQSPTSVSSGTPQPTPASGTPHQTPSHQYSQLFSSVPPASTSASQINPMLSISMPRNPGSESTFTPELPMEVKQLALLDHHDPLTHSLLYGNTETGGDFDWNSFTGISAGPEGTIPAMGNSTTSISEDNHYGDSTFQLPHQYFSFPGHESTIGTPGGGSGGERWDYFLDQSQMDSHQSDSH